MPDAATWGVLASGSVGVGGLVVAGYSRWLDDRASTRAVTRERFDELRGRLDQAASGITRAIFALDDALPALMRDPPTDEDGNTVDDDGRWWARKEVEAVRDAVKAVWPAENRLAVRLGPDHSIIKAHDLAVAPLQAALVVLDELLGGEAADTERLRRLNECRAAAVKAQREFFSEAAVRIGPKE